MDSAFSMGSSMGGGLADSFGSMGSDVGGGLGGGMMGSHGGTDIGGGLGGGTGLMDSLTKTGGAGTRDKGTTDKTGSTVEEGPNTKVRLTDFLGQRTYTDPKSKEGQAIGGTAGQMIGSIWGPIGSMIGKRAGTDIGGTIQDVATQSNPWKTLFHRFITNPMKPQMGGQ